MSNEKLNRSSLIRATVAVVLLAVAAWIWFDRQALQDKLLVYTYTPTSDIVQIRDNAKFTKTGELYFYASTPSVENAETFNDHCERKEERSAILGCYANRRIYIYNITNEQLNGIQEVTAAHEMLHAAWDRLSTGEKDELASLLETAYRKVKTTELNERLDYYARQQPGERANELHSILATEFMDLGQELEKYYSRYFVDRSVVVEMHDRYQKIFNDLKSQTENLADELNKLATKINQQKKVYDSAVTELNQDIVELNARSRAVDRTDPAEVDAFNSDRASLLARASNLENTRSNLNSMIQSYNAKLAIYNSTVARSEQLHSSIDSTLDPAPQL